MFLTQILEITTANPATVNDAAIGSTVSGSPRNAGQLGAIYHLDKATADKLSLKPGFYQYVQTKSDSTASPAAGLVALWSDRASFIVTPDTSAAAAGQIAGVYLGSLTKGNYGFIQIAGQATVKFVDSITKATPAAGDLVIVDTTAAKGEVLADATGLTSTTAKRILGVAAEAPTNAGSKLVDLTPLFINVP
jgi:hypothetical protein